MQKRWFFLLVLVGLTGATLRADDPPSPERIEELVKKLGSSKFAEREKAKTELQEIGAPALNALRKAAKSDGEDLARRANELLQKLETKINTETLLAPKKVRLNVKDVPATEAIAELAKLSGYTIEIQGDREPLTQRKVTLDTGEVPFWKAFDQLCEQAKLVEVPTAIQNPLRPRPGFPIRPGLPVQPIERPGLPPFQPVPMPGAPGIIPPPQPMPVNPGFPSFEVEGGGFLAVQAPAQDPPRPAQPQIPVPAGLNPEDAAKYREIMELIRKPLPPAADPKAREEFMKQRRDAIDQLIQLQRKAQPVQPPVIQPPVMPVQPRLNPQLEQPVTASPNTIVVRDGEYRKFPTIYSGSVRIRALPASMAQEVRLAPQQEGEVMVILEVTAEPRLQGFRLASGMPRIDKALDDRSQFLFPNMEEPANPGLIDRFGNPLRPQQIIVQRNVALRFKADKKISNELVELAGCVTGLVPGDPTELLSIPDVMNAENKSARHPDGRVVEVVKSRRVGAAFHLHLRVIGDGGDNVIVVGDQHGNVMGIGDQRGNVIMGRGGRIGNLSIDDHHQNVLTLVDAKGKALPLQYMALIGSTNINGQLTPEYNLVFQPNENQTDPARLIVAGQRQQVIPIPFSFEKIPVQ